MCGRYGFIASDLKTWGLQDEIPGIEDNYNAAPGSFLPVLVKKPQLEVDLMKWGLVPHWSKTPSVKFSTINARAETVQTSPVFRDAFSQNRCLVPCAGFYEWRKNPDGTKTPFFIHLKNSSSFALAGIWDAWVDAGAKELKTYSIITTTPNELMATIHNRMPVILSKADEEAWLDPNTPIEITHALFQPFDPSNMEAYMVDPRVNSTRNNDKQLFNKTDN